MDLPDGVVLQNLVASKNKITFALAMPTSVNADDPVRDITRKWEKNEDLKKSVSSIRPLTGERRTQGDESIFYYQFECILKN